MAGSLLIFAHTDLGVVSISLCKHAAYVLTKSGLRKSHSQNLKPVTAIYILSIIQFKTEEYSIKVSNGLENANSVQLASGHRSNVLCKKLDKQGFQCC